MGQGYPPQRPLRRPHLSCHCAGGLTGWRWWWDGSTCPEDVTVLLPKPLLLPHSLCLQKALQMQPQAAQDGAQSTDPVGYIELAVMSFIRRGLRSVPWLLPQLKLRLGKPCGVHRV